MKIYNKNHDCEVIPDRNAVSLESFVNDDEKYEERDYIFLISQMLLELREKFNATTETTRFVSEKILDIVRIDIKKHSDAIHKSLKKKYDNFVIDHETSVILFN